ncbi:MAG TPA: hypothetical protein PK307_06855 [Spirochaetota bacterium]|nr:hypothetical protein [Spirochaetota bacterium]
MEISAIRLRNSYQINYVDTNNLFVTQNSFCVVETEHGLDIGHVFKCRKCAGGTPSEVKGKLLRLATEEDLFLPRPRSLLLRLPCRVRLRPRPRVLRLLLKITKVPRPYEWIMSASTTS